MAHDHHHAHGDHSTSKIRIAFFINLGFSVIELIGGLYTNSVAILSDALHDLGDSMSLGVSWYFQKVARKGRDKEFSYGYRRFSVLGAVINSLVLVVGLHSHPHRSYPQALRPCHTRCSGYDLFGHRWNPGQWTCRLQTPWRTFSERTSSVPAPPGRCAGLGSYADCGTHHALSRLADCGFTPGHFHLTVHSFQCIQKPQKGP